MGNTHRSCSATAISNVTVLCVALAEFQKILREYRPIFYIFHRRTLLNKSLHKMLNIKNYETLINNSKIYNLN